MHCRRLFTTKDDSRHCEISWGENDVAENRRSRLKFIGRSSTQSSCICDLSVTYKHSEGYNGKVRHLPTLKQCQVWLMGKIP